MKEESALLNDWGSEDSFGVTPGRIQSGVDQPVMHTVAADKDQEQIKEKMTLLPDVESTIFQFSVLDEKKPLYQSPEARLKDPMLKFTKSKMVGSKRVYQPIGPPMELAYHQLTKFKFPRTETEIENEIPRPPSQILEFEEDLRESVGTEVITPEKVQNLVNRELDTPEF